MRQTTLALTGCQRRHPKDGPPHGILPVVHGILITKIRQDLIAPVFQFENMGNILNEDFTEFLKALNACKVEYVLIGGYAVIYHGYNRTTGDLDVWVNPTDYNYRKLLDAFQQFGLSPFDMTESRFLQTDTEDVFSFGRPPVSIDILTKVRGLTFDETFQNSALLKFDGVDVRMIDIRDLLATKKATNRPKDQDDLEHLK